VSPAAPHTLSALFRPCRGSCARLQDLGARSRVHRTSVPFLARLRRSQTPSEHLLEHLSSQKVNRKSPLWCVAVGIIAGGVEWVYGCARLPLSPVPRVSPRRFRRTGIMSGCSAADLHSALFVRSSLDSPLPFRLPFEESWADEERVGQTRVCLAM
jgi:hypothetical protein